MFKRFVVRRGKEALSDTPVVLIVGPRRAAKTTLVKGLGEAGRTYIGSTIRQFEAARSDPADSFGAWNGLSSTRFSVRPACSWRSRRRSMKIIAHAVFCSRARPMC